MRIFAGVQGGAFLKHNTPSTASAFLGAAVLLLTASASPALAGILRIAFTNDQAAVGIRQALLTATADAVRVTGRPNGYFGDAAIKILLPQSLQPVATGLRAIGYGPQIDQFVLSMNRAAEAAAPKAEPIFEQAITGMTLADAQRIVMGGKHAATDYFKQTTSSQLTTAFTPIVKQTMTQYAVTRQYDELLGRYQSGAMALGGLTPEFRYYALRRSEKPRRIVLCGRAGGSENSHESSRTNYSIAQRGFRQSSVTDRAVDTAGVPVKIFPFQ